MNISSRTAPTLVVALLAFIFVTAQSATADDPLAAMPLVVGKMTLTPRIRIVDRVEGVPSVVDLELQHNVGSGGILFVADPFFTCQSPIYSAVFLYTDDGQYASYLRIPPLQIWDGETQGRFVEPGEIYGRRFILFSPAEGPSARPRSKAPKRRLKMQLVLFDGIALEERRLEAIRGQRMITRESARDAVAKSELVDLGEIPSDLHFRLIDPEFGEPSKCVKSGLDIRLYGPSEHVAMVKPSHVNVIIHNNSSTMAPLFDPRQNHYGSDSSPIERELFSLPDETSVFHSEDGVNPLFGSESLTGASVNWWGLFAKSWVDWKSSGPNVLRQDVS